MRKHKPTENAYHQTEMMHHSRVILFGNCWGNGTTVGKAQQCWISDVWSHRVARFCSEAPRKRGICLSSRLSRLRSQSMQIASLACALTRQMHHHVIRRLQLQRSPRSTLNCSFKVSRPILWNYRSNPGKMTPFSRRRQAADVSKGLHKLREGCPVISDLKACLH